MAETNKTMGKQMTAASQTHTWEPRYATRAKRMQASEIRELLKLLDQPGLISFAGGIPDPVLFPLGDVREAYQAILASDNDACKALQYSVSEGLAALRSWIAGHMAGKGVTCAPENILITCGSQQGLEFLGRLFLSPKDTALVMAPTYLGALQAFSSNEPVYDYLQIENTNRTAESYQQAAAAAGGEVKFAYVVPDFANPTGITLNVEARQSLLTLAEQLDIPVIEDSPYSALRYGGEAEPTLQALDIARCGSIEASRVIHCGSFSKVFTPGLRVGWVCAARRIIDRLTLIKQASDLNSPAINQSVVLYLAQHGFDQQITKSCDHYRLKRDAMLRALEAHMPEGVHWSKPDGGFFIWVTLPDGMDGAALLEKAVSEAKVAFVPGHAFFADGSGANTIRMSFSLPDVATIERGTAALCQVIRAHLKK